MIKTVIMTVFEGYEHLDQIVGICVAAALITLSTLCFGYVLRRR